MTRLLGTLVVLLMYIVPSYAQTQTTTSAVESSHVFCSSTCQIYGGQVNNTSASSLWVMLFDASTAPTGGGASITGCTNASASRPCVLKWYQILANSTLGMSQFLEFQSASRIPTKSGFVAACSSTGPFTLTYSTSCTFSFEVLAP